jgi:hypothetical protein
MLGGKFVVGAGAIESTSGCFVRLFRRSGVAGRRGAGIQSGDLPLAEVYLCKSSVERCYL